MVGISKARRLAVRAVSFVITFGSASIATAQPFAYVLTDRTGTNDLVQVFDTATLARMTTIPVGNGKPAVYGAGIAASPDGGRVYVVNGDDQTISVVSTPSNTVAATWPAGPNATTIVVSPDGSRLYVGNGSSGGMPTQIRIISTATGGTIGSVSLGGPSVFATLGIAVSPDGRRLYATGWTGLCSGNTIKVIDTAAGGVVGSIPVASFPTGLAVAPDGTALYAASMSSSCTGGGNGFVSVINTASNANLGTIGVGVNPHALAVTPDGQRVFVPNNGVPFSVSIISRATHTVTGSIPGGTHMRDLAFTPDGRRAFAPWDDGVAAFDAVTNTSLGSVMFNAAVDGQPRSIVVLPMPPDPPEPPTDLIAAAITGHQVTLQWRAPTTGSIPTGYEVEGGLAPGQVIATLPTGSSLPAHTFTAPSGVFYVRVRAVVSSVRGQPSNEVRIAVSPPLAPSAPEGLVAMVNGSSLALAWRNTAAGGVADRIALDVTGATQTTLSLPAGEAFTFSGVLPGTYTVSVRAVNAHGTSPSSNEVTLTFPEPCSGVPQPPEALRLYKVGSRVFVYWAPATTGAAPTSYVLRVTGSFAGAFATTERTLSGNVDPGTYHISVAGSNACGEGAPGATTTVIVP